MATKMATVNKAEELLEKLRSASWNAAVQGSMLVIVSYWVQNVASLLFFDLSCETLSSELVCLIRITY